MKSIFYFALVIPIFIAGCSLPDPEEIAINELMEAFVASIDRGDEDLGRACMLDVAGFNILNPDVGERADGDVFTEVSLAELFHNYRALVDKYRGQDVKFISITTGDLWSQHKGRRAFVDNIIKIEVNGTPMDLPVKGIANIEQNWKIVELSNYEDY